MSAGKNSIDYSMENGKLLRVPREAERSKLTDKMLHVLMIATERKAERSATISANRPR